MKQVVLNGSVFGKIETERAMMDCHGLFYEVGFHLYADQLWAIRPVCSHLRVIPDYCSWRGMFSREEIRLHR